MATRGLYCLLLPIREIDLPVKRREYNNKTRRPYGALINRLKETPLTNRQEQQTSTWADNLGWGDLGEQNNLRVI